MSLIGLKNFRVAKLTEDTSDTLNYDELIKKLLGAKTIKISPKVDTAENYGDDQLLETATAMSAIEVEMEVAELTLEEKAFIYGYDYTGGVLKETKDFNPPELAFGFEAKKSNGGIRNVWLVKGKAEPPEDENKTKEDKVEFQSEKLKMKFMPRIHDGVTKYTADSDGENAITAEQFFTTDFLKSGTKPEM